MKLQRKCEQTPETKTIDQSLFLEEYKILSDERKNHANLTIQAGAVTSAVVTWILKTAMVDITNQNLKLIFLGGALLFVAFAIIVGTKVVSPHFKQKEVRIIELANNLGFIGPKGRLPLFILLSNAVFIVSFAGIWLLVVYVLI